MLNKLHCPIFWDITPSFALVGGAIFPFPESKGRKAVYASICTICAIPVFFFFGARGKKPKKRAGGVD